MKLHEAIQEVILEAGEGLTPSEIAEAVNSKQLYTRKDGRPLPSSQISARVNEYNSLFERDENNKVILLSHGKVEELSWRCYDLLSKIDRNNHGDIRSVEKTLSILIFLIIYIRLAHWDKLNSFKNDYWGNFFSNLSDFVAHLELQNKHLLIEYLDSITDQEKVIIDWAMLNQKVFHLVDLKDIKKVVIDLLSQDKNFNKNEYQSSQNLSNLFGSMSKRISFESVVDPTCGTGNSYFRILDNSEIHKGEAFEINNGIALIASMVSFLFYPETSTVSCRNSLSRKTDKEFDLVAFVPPFNMKIGEDQIGYKIVDLPKRKTYTSEEVFIYKALELLNRDGKAIINVPESTLLSPRLLELREYLVSNRYIESIISLPVGTLYPVSAIKSSLLVLSKEKKESIYFLDAENWSKKLGRELRLQSESIADIWSKKEVIKAHSFRKEYIDIDSSNLSFSYLNLSLNFREITSKVGDFLKIFPLEKADESNHDAPCISVYNLKDSESDFKLRIEDLDSFNKKFTTDKLRQYRRLKGRAILISKVGAKIKPTLLLGNDDFVLVDRNILCFSVHQEFSDEAESITKSLYDLDFNKRVSSINYGTTIASRTTKDFLSLPFEKQEFFADSEEKPFDISKYAGDLFGLFRHDFVQPVATLSLKYDSLKHALMQWGLENDSDLMSFIVSKRGTTITDLIHEMDVQLNEIQHSLSTSENLYNGKLEIETCDVKELINECYNEIDQEVKQKLNISIRGELEQALDRGQLKTLFINLLNNAIKHGLTDYMNVVFELQEHEEEGYLEIKYFNDGKPFPSNFSLDKFISPLSKGDTSDGTGHGGFIINTIVKNHQGRVDQDWEEPIPKFFNEIDRQHYNVYLRFTLKPML